MISGASLGHLFIGGIIPGLFLGFAMMVYIAYISHKRNYPTGEAFNSKILIKSFFKAFFPLLTPVILLWGIYGGVFTPTEAAAATVLYALILSVIGYRILGLKKLFAIFKESALSTGYVSAMVAAALIFSYIVSREQFAVALTYWVMNSGIITNKYMYLLFVNVFLLLLGAIMDPIVGELIVMPILIPIAIFFKIDLIHLGVISVLNAMIGLSTPPYGENLFIVKDSKLLTPKTDFCLNGITRQTVMQLASDLDIEVEEKNLIFDELVDADEAFFSGTAVEITPITKVDNLIIGSGSIGPISQRLQSKYSEIVCGKDTTYSDWLTYI
jgi:tripartite ATP-independent transporter DctM subunit